MKTSYRLLATVMYMTLPIISLQAQEKLQHLVIHEDYVLPSQMPKYEEASKNLVKALSENAIADARFWAFWQDDNTCVFASPVENFAALDQNMWKSLEDKIGKDNSETLFKAFDGTYQSHRTFMVNYHPDLSYKADQLSTGNSNYRVWTFLYFYPENQDAMLKISNEWKQLYESKNVPYGYTVYSNGFGMEGPVLVVHDWASSPEEYAKHNDEIQKLMGPELEDLRKRTQSLLYKIDHKTGWYSEDLSYSPED